MFTIKALQEKSALLQSGSIKVGEGIDKVNATKLELFKMIKKYDRH